MGGLLMIKKNISEIFSEMENACRRAGRNFRDITVVGVTKFVPPAMVQEAIDAGILHIAENRVQEALVKFPGLLARNPLLKAHLIGHLQTNKVREAVEVCSLIQSVDSLRLAEFIEKEALKRGKAVDVLVQFNCTGEQQKFGARPQEANALIENIGGLEHVHIRGVMGMAPFTQDQGPIRKTFSQLRAVKEGLEKRFAGHPRVDMGILSMGMSSDYPIAIEEGSTMIRVGRAIFNEP